MFDPLIETQRVRKDEVDERLVSRRTRFGRFGAYGREEGRPMDELRPTPNARRLDQPFSVTLRSATVIGGCGVPFAVGDSVYANFNETELRLKHPDGPSSVMTYEEMVALETFGPGTVVSSADLIGGGFGWEGALQGIVASEVINRLTERRSTETYVRVASREAEVFLLHTEATPADLRIRLSHAFVRSGFAGRS